MNEQQQYFDIPEDELTLSRNLAQLQVTYDQLIKDYQVVKQELVYKDAQIAQLRREKEEIDKQFNDMLIHTQAKIEQVRNLTIEIPHETLYGLAMNWQEPTKSIFVICNRDTGEVRLKTEDEMDPDKKPIFRHWWTVDVMGK